VRGLALAVVVVIAVFGIVVTFPFVDWDDAMHVTDNVLTLHPLARGWSRLLFTPSFGYPVPVLMLSFAADRALFGLNPAGFHFMNLVFHIVNVTLVYFLARRLGQKEVGAAAAALIFGVHPVVAEPVAWVTGRKDLLATGLLIASLLTFLGSSRRRVTLATLLSIAAILAKPSAVVAPALLWLAARQDRPDAPRKALAMSLVPLSLAASLLLVLGVRGQRAVGAIVLRDWPAAASDVTGALWMQIGHLVVPTQLLAAYYRHPGDPPAWAMIAAVAIAAGLAFAVTRSPRGSLERFGVAFAGVAYIPASNLLAGWRWVADSYLYLPLVGIALAVASFADRTWPLRLRKVGLALAIFALLDLAFLAHVQSRTWSSSVALWQPVYERYPDDVHALAAIAGAYHWEGRDEQAVRAFVDLEERFPDYADVRDDEAWARMALGQKERATKLIERGIYENNAGCIRQFWLALLRSPDPPPVAQRDLVARAFDVGFEAMKSGLRRPEELRRVAEILDALGLADRAEKAREQAQSLEAR
jgi:hypothetical protein